MFVCLMTNFLLTVIFAQRYSFFDFSRMIVENHHHGGKRIIRTDKIYTTPNVLAQGNAIYFINQRHISRIAPGAEAKNGRNVKSPRALRQKMEKMSNRPGR
jgi:hypothetical protein